MSAFWDNFSSAGYGGDTLDPYYAGEGTGIGGTDVPSYDYSTASTNETLNSGVMAGMNTTNTSTTTVSGNPAFSGIGAMTLSNLSQIGSLWAAKQAGVLPYVQNTLQTPTGARPVSQQQQNGNVILFAALGVGLVLLLQD